MTKTLPKLLISLFLLFACFSLSVSLVLAQEETTTETVGELDSGDPAWGEDVKETVTVRPGGGLPQIKVGVIDQEFRFPDLTELNNTLENAIPALLPESQLKLYSPPPLESLNGKFFHPICRIDDNAPSSSDDPSEGVSNVKTPDWWSNTLAITKLAQAIGVSTKNSGVKFENANPVFPGEEKNTPLDFCPQAPGTSDNIIDRETSTDQTQIRFNLIGWLLDLLSNLAPGESKRVEVVSKPTGFVQGEKEFAEQTSRDFGFLRSFCQEDQCPKEVDGLVNTPYRGGDGQIDLVFQGLGGAREGYELLQESLYPEELQSLRALPLTPPLPPRSGTGIFVEVGNPSDELTNRISGAASAFGVPPGVLAAVAWVEGGSMWSRTSEEIRRYSAPGAEYPNNCDPNSCGARGPMQFTYGVASSCGRYTDQFLDSWSGYANAYNEATGENRQTKVCNIADSMYAASKKLKQNSGATSADWTQDQVFRAVGRYYGEGDTCQEVHARLGNKTYCQFVWDNYK